MYKYNCIQHTIFKNLKVKSVLEKCLDHYKFYDLAAQSKFLNKNFTKWCVSQVLSKKSNFPQKGCWAQWIKDSPIFFHEKHSFWNISRKTLPDVIGNNNEIKIQNLSQRFGQNRKKKACFKKNEKKSRKKTINFSLSIFYYLLQETTK